MILKSVAIEGFKGISNRIELELSPKLTVFFGPVAYGKSSILEAILWCLSCNSLESGDWRKIQKMFEDIEIINLRKPKAEVKIEYEHNGNEYVMFAETKTEKGYGFKAYDSGIFKELSIGELEITPFVRVLTTAQIRKFEFSEDLEALNVVFGITFWKKLADSCDKLAETIRDKERDIIEKVTSWKAELEKIYTRVLDRYNEITKIIEDENINLESIKRCLKELTSKDLDQYSLDDLLSFVRQMTNPYHSKLSELEDEIQRRLSELGQLKVKCSEIEGRIHKIKQTLNEIQPKLEELMSQPSIEILDNEVMKLEEAYRSIVEHINNLGAEKRNIEDEKFRKNHKLSILGASYNRISVLEKELNTINTKLREFDQDLDKKWEELKDKLNELNEQKKQLEEELGEESKIVEILEQAIKLMKEDICIVCGEEGGLTKAKERCEILKRKREDDYERLEEIKKEIEEHNRLLDSIEAQIKRRNELINKAKAIQQNIESELRKAGVKTLNELEERINSLVDEINTLNGRISKINEEIRNKESEKIEIDKKLREIRNRIFRLSNMRDEINSLLGKIGINAWNLPLNDLQLKISELKDELQSLESERKTLHKKITEIEKSINRLKNERRKLEIKENMFDGKKNELVRQISDLMEYEEYKEKIEELESVIDVLLQDFNKINKILREYEKRRLFYLRLSKAVKDFMRMLVKQKLSEFNDLVNKFYRSLYEHPEFKEIRIKFDQRYRIAVIDSSGNEVGYEEILNTSARNAVRIAISSACSYYGLGRSEFNLLIIDEPQLYLDSKHKKKFIKDFLPLIYEKCQVILATADKEFWDYIKQYKPKEAKLYEIKSWSLKDGPMIEEVL